MISFPQYFLAQPLLYYDNESVSCTYACIFDSIPYIVPFRPVKMASSRSYVFSKYSRTSLQKGIRVYCSIAGCIVWGCELQQKQQLTEL